MPVAVSGSIATDHLMRFPGKFSEQLLADQLHKISLSFLVDDLEIHRGGIGANIAYAMGLLGSDPVLVGAVGEDFAEYRQWLERHGVNCAGIYTSQAKHTARFVSTTDEEMNQISSFYAGAMAETGQIDLAAIAQNIGGLDLVLISPSDPDAMLNQAKVCRDRGFPFAADPSQQLARFDGQQVISFVEGAKYLFTNDYEWELLLNKTGWSEQQVLEHVEYRVTTLGPDGVRVVGKDGTDFTVTAVPERKKENPTGVGDAFRAGFLRGVYAGLSLERSAQLGSLVAVHVLETVGPQEWSLDRADALERVKGAFGAEAADELGRILPA